MLTTKQYDQRELSAKIELSFHEIMAYATSTFDSFGFPSRVTDEKELRRYADWNCEGANITYFYKNYYIPSVGVDTRFTEEESSLLKQVQEQVAEMTEKNFGKKIRPITALFSQMGLFRIVMGLKKLYKKKTISVFEIGPGIGYLGAYLSLTGDRYASIDNSQSLYLWQSAMLEQMAKGDFYEWAASGSPQKTDQYRIQHLPWWEYLMLRRECPIKADVVISNTNLGEMNRLALIFTLQMAKKLVEHSDIKMFFFTNPGWEKQNTLTDIHALLHAYGFKQVCGNRFFGYVPQDHQAIDLSSLDAEIPHYGNTSKFIDAIDAITIDKETLPIDLDFARFVNVFEVPDKMLPTPVVPQQIVAQLRPEGSSKKFTKVFSRFKKMFTS